MLKRVLAISVSISLAGIGLAGMPTSAVAAKKYQIGPCAYEDKIPKEWESLQYFYEGMNECLGPVKIVAQNLGKNKPKTKSLTAASSKAINDCKITNINNDLRAFPNDFQKQFNLVPNSNTVIQVLPITTSDAPVKNGSTPTSDYGRYFKFLTDYYRYATDGPSEFEIRVPSKYLEFSKPLMPVNIGHHVSDAQLDIQRNFGKEIYTEFKSQIDFKGADMILVVVPAGTSTDSFEQGGLGWVRNDDGRMTFMSTAMPYTINKVPNRNRTSLTPMWWMHELYHIGAGLSDHNENNYWQNHRGDDPSQPGMGNWGLMSMSMTELTTWEKWVLGITKDSQVYCLSPKFISKAWLAPTEFKTKEHKMAVVPISSTKVIVIESRRAAGLDYKLPKDSEGALVYTVDVSQQDREYGYRVISNRPPNHSQPFVLSSAPLKKGESVTTDGVKITNVELGEFGDVIKVEPAK